MTVPRPVSVCPDCGAPLPPEQSLCPACLMRQALASRTLARDGDKTPQLPPPSPEEIADRFPGYEILECLGRGGMGAVYKARQKSLNRLVAIKILAPERVGEGRFAERFTIEAELLAKLGHPHIVTIHDFGETGGLFYLVMEFIDGVNLRDLLRDGKLESQQALAIVPPICDALQYAHEKGIVHRDIKPENILLDRDGRVKIADFGIASLVGATGESSGTPPYMAPEQSGGTVDHRADVYALGVVLYEMLTGERPEKNLIAPSSKVQLDVKIDEIVLRALEKEPELRYQTAGEFRTVVETMAHPDRSSGSAASPSDEPFQASESNLRPVSPPLANLALGLSIAGALIPVAFLWTDGPDSFEHNVIRGSIVTGITLSALIAAIGLGWCTRRLVRGRVALIAAALSLLIAVVSLFPPMSSEPPLTQAENQSRGNVSHSSARLIISKERGGQISPDGVIYTLDGEMVAIEKLQERFQQMVKERPELQVTVYAHDPEVSAGRAIAAMLTARTAGVKHIRIDTGETYGEKPADADRSADQSLATYDWEVLNAKGELKDGVAEKINGRTGLKIQNLQDAPKLARLLTILTPPIKTRRYAIRGEIRYENVKGTAYLEMWNNFPHGRFFSRTLNEPGSGPMAQITGTSDWRPFILPFDQTGSATPPNRIELNLHLPGRGMVFVAPLELIVFGTEQVPEAVVQPVGGGREIGENLPTEIIDRQNEFVKIMGQIESKHPGIYIGAEVGDVCKIYLKGEAPEEVTELVKKSDLVIEVVDKLPYSMKELDEKREQAVALVSKAGYTHEGSSIDVPNEIRILVGLKEGLPSEEKEIMKLFPEDLAKVIRVETIGGKDEAPGVVGYVVDVDPEKQSFLLTSYEPEAGLSACNNATWFHKPNNDLKPGQKAKVWFSGMLESYPGQAAAIRTEVDGGELADRMAHVIRFALEKRKEAKAAGIPFVVSVDHDKTNKRWKVLFASDANEGKVDPGPIMVADEEL